MREEETLRLKQSPSLCNWVGAHRKYVQFIYNVLDCGAGTQMVNLVVSRQLDKRKSETQKSIHEMHT